MRPRTGVRAGGGGDQGKDEIRERWKRSGRRGGLVEQEIMWMNRSGGGGGDDGVEKFRRRRLWAGTKSGGTRSEGTRSEGRDQGERDQGQNRIKWKMRLWRSWNHRGVRTYRCKVEIKRW